MSDNNVLESVCDANASRPPDEMCDSKLSAMEIQAASSASPTEEGVAFTLDIQEPYPTDPYLFKDKVLTTDLIRYNMVHVNLALRIILEISPMITTIDVSVWLGTDAL